MLGDGRRGPKGSEARHCPDPLAESFGEEGDGLKERWNIKKEGKQTSSASDMKPINQ